MPATASRRPNPLDLAWAALAIACLAAMIAWPAWEAVPFHVIWVALTLLYGFRIWSLKGTATVLAAVMLVCGISIFRDVRDGMQDWGELFEVPLLSAMFLAMVWHARRRLQMLQTVEALADERAALLEHEERLLHDISHELRTPVTIARGHLELLARRLGSETAELTVAFDELGRMKLMIDRILLLAQAERGDDLQRECVPLVPFLEDIVVRWAGVAPRAWRLGTVVDVSLEADPTWLHAAVDALVENAVQHTDDYGRIEIAAHAEPNAVVITVRDDGPGVPDQLLGRIFERFARSDASRSRHHGGSGLGLSIVSAIARAHGGSCRAENAAAGGIVFELRFPLLRASSAEREEEAGPSLVEATAALQP
jgi:signal transduction histidine kinase